MKLAIIGAAGALNYRLLDKKLNELIEENQFFLFYVLCGDVEGKRSKEKSLGELWAEKNGAPVLYIHEKTADRLVNKMILEADYGIFILDGNPLINNIFMKFKMAGKHGSVIKTRGEE